MGGDWCDLHPIHIFDFLLGCIAVRVVFVKPFFKPLHVTHKKEKKHGLERAINPRPLLHTVVAYGPVHSMS